VAHAAEHGPAEAPASTTKNDVKVGCTDKAAATVGVLDSKFNVFQDVADHPSEAGKAGTSGQSFCSGVAGRRFLRPDISPRMVCCYETTVGGDDGRRTCSPVY